jgi:copper chaperone
VFLPGIEIEHMEKAIEFKYKTNLHGSECIDTITPHLDAVIGLKRWSVDMDDPDKTLTVHVADPGQTITVALAIEKAGYAASLIEEPSESGANLEWEEA